MKTASIVSDSASDALETPESLAEALDTGFLPEDENYRLTGTFEKPPEKKDDSAASTHGKEKPPAKDEDATAASQQEQEDDASKAAASATAQTQRPQRRESRWEKRERELKTLREENARLKAGSSQQQQTQQRSETAQPSSQTTQAATETTGKAAPKPKIDDLDNAGKPKFKTYAEYEDAKDAWLRQETIREFNESQARTQQLTQQQQAEREIGVSLNKKFAGPRAKYPDFDAVALSDALTIPKGSVTELFMLDSEHAGEVLYHLGQHPEILQGFYRDHDPKTGKFTSLLSAQQQFRKLMAIEAQVSGEASRTEGERSSSSARTVSQASRPAHQVSGKGTVAKEAVEQAVEDADFETYAQAQNAKDLARFKRK